MGNIREEKNINNMMFSTSSHVTKKLKSMLLALLLISTPFLGISILTTSAEASFDLMVEVTYISSSKDWDGPDAAVEFWIQFQCQDSDGGYDNEKITGSYKVDYGDSPWDWDDKDNQGNKLINDLRRYPSDCHDKPDQNDIRMKIFEDDIFGDPDDMVTHWVYADLNDEDTSADYFYVSKSGNSPDAPSYSYSVTFKIWWND